MEFNKKAWKIGRISLNDRLVVKKNILDSVFVISGNIEVEVSVTSEGRTFFFIPDFTKTLSTVFPRIILDGGDYYFFFSHKKELIIRGR